MSARIRATFICAFALLFALSLTACGAESMANPPSTSTSPGAKGPAISSDMLSQIEAGFASGNPATPTTNPAECPPITGKNQHATVHTPCVVEPSSDRWSSAEVRITFSGFKPREAINTLLTGPTGEIVEKYDDIAKANANGNVLNQSSMGFLDSQPSGEYTLTIEGRESGHKAVAHYYFKAIFRPTPTPIPGFSDPVDVKLDTATGHNSPESALKVAIPFRAEINLASPGDIAYFTFDVTAEQESHAGSNGMIIVALTNPYYAEADAVVTAQIGDGRILENDVTGSNTSTNIGVTAEGTYTLKVTAKGVQAPADEPIALEVTIRPDND
jgi:hypothetical protein